MSATRRSLDRAAVVEAAAALLDAAEGRDVTLGEIAAELGVRTPSLYNHIAGQEDLRNAVAVFGVQELGKRLGRAAIGKAGADALRALGHAYRAFAKERPGLYLATLRAPDPGNEELEAAAADVLSMLGLVLEPYRLSEEEVIHAIRAFRSVMHGFVSLELAGGFGLPVNLEESFHQLLDMYIQSLERQATGEATIAGSPSEP